MGNTTPKSEQKFSELKQEVLLLKSSILSVKEKINCFKNSNTEVKVIDPENEKLEIQYFKNFLLELEKQKTELECWRFSKFEEKIAKTMKKFMQLGGRNRFKVWKKRVAEEYGSNVKDKVEIEGIFTMDSLEAIDGMDEVNIELIDLENIRSEKIGTLSIIDIYRIFEDFMFYKHIRNIKESVRKVEITRMPEAFKEYLQQTYNKNTVLKKNDIFQSLIKHSDKHFLIKVLSELVSCTESYNFPAQIELLITDIINSFNKIKIITESISTSQACRLEGGSATLYDVFIVLNNLIGSKKLIYRILRELKPDELSNTDYLNNLIIISLKYCNLSPEQLYIKLNYAKNKNIWCSDIIDGINFYSPLKIPEEDFKYFFQLFMQDSDSILSKELILQCLNPKSVNFQSILVKKLQLIKAIINVFRDTEQEFLQFSFKKFEEQDSKSLNLDQFAKVLKKLNKNYDWDFAHSLFKPKKNFTDKNFLLSKNSFEKLIFDYKLSSKTLLKFHKDYERYIKNSPELGQKLPSLSENFLIESNKEDLENSFSVLIEDLDL
jgi:hypothetical protein